MQQKPKKVLGLTTSSPNRPRYSKEQQSLDETYLGKVAMEKKKRVVTVLSAMENIGSDAVT